MSNVNHPSHYNAGKIEVIEFLEDQFMNRPHEWNATKYLCRADKKGREIEDLEKAIWYIKRKIELLKAANEVRSPTRPNAMNARLDPELTKISKAYSDIAEKAKLQESISATAALNSEVPEKQVDIAPPNVPRLKLALSGIFCANEFGVVVFVPHCENHKIIHLSGMSGEAHFDVAIVKL